MDRFFDQIKSEHGRVDVVYAKAGVLESASIDDIQHGHFDRLFDINVKGTVYTVQKALPLMSAGGSVVLTGSGAGSNGFPKPSVFSVQHKNSKNPPKSAGLSGSRRRFPPSLI